MACIAQAKADQSGREGAVAAEDLLSELAGKLEGDVVVRWWKLAAEAASCRIDIGGVRVRQLRGSALDRLRHRHGALEIRGRYFRRYRVSGSGRLEARGSRLIGIDIEGSYGVEVTQVAAHSFIQVRKRDAVVLQLETRTARHRGIGLDEECRPRG